MIKENSKAVEAPAIKPLSLAFAPDITPPKNIAMKAAVRISQLTDCSVKEVNDKTSEMTKLNDKTITNTVVSPTNTAGKNPR